MNRPRFHGRQEKPGLDQPHYALGLLPDLAEGLLGLYPDVTLALEKVIAQYLFLGGRGEASGRRPSIKEQPQAGGEGTGTASRERELGSLIASQTFGTTESQRDTENPEPSPPTQCDPDAQRRARPGQAQLATYCLFLPVELGGVLPCVLGYHSHSCLTSAIFCLGLSGQLQAGEGWELLCGSKGCPSLPSPPQEGMGPLHSHLPSPTASVCTWTVKSCLELPWNTEM